MSALALSRDYVLSLERGLQVIRSFGHDAARMTLSDVARRTGLSRAAARRFLLTLTELGYVTFDGKRFSLTPRVLGLGYAYLSSFTIVDLSQPFLERVSERLHESCSISVLDRRDIVYVARVPARRIMSVSISIGTRLPAHATSMGQVLLAALSPERLDNYFRDVELASFTAHTVTDEAELRALLKRVAAQGYSIADQELEAGLRSIAVPVRDRSGSVVAAMNVSAHAARASMADLVRNFLPELRRAAADLTAALPS
jgi:IclR family pca regulon transcriptional regulator